MRIRRIPLILLAAVAACHPGSGGNPNPDGGGGPVKATVHDLLASGALVGRTVEVTGTCLGYSSPTIARGSPPRTRSDWQLEDQGEAIWVTGPMTEGCSATVPASAPGSITAVVAQDTLPGLGGGTPTSRQYLVRQ